MGIWPEDFYKRMVTEALFQEISSDHDLLYDFMEKKLSIQTAREKERRILDETEVVWKKPRWICTWDGTQR